MRILTAGNDRASLAVCSRHAACRLRRASRRGFTIVELMIVILLIGVMSAMIVPQYFASSQLAQLREQASQMLMAAQYARNYAVSHRCLCRLVVDQDQQAYLLEYQEDPEKSQDFSPMNSGPIRPAKLSSGVSFGKVWIQPADLKEQDSDCITFTPLGQADAAIIEIKSERGTWSLVLSPSGGRARLVEGTVEQVDDDRQDLDEG